VKTNIAEVSATSNAKSDHGKLLADLTIGLVAFLGLYWLGVGSRQVGTALWPGNEDKAAGLLGDAFWNVLASAIYTIWIRGIRKRKVWVRAIYGFLVVMGIGGAILSVASGANFLKILQAIMFVALGILLVANWGYYNVAWKIPAAGSAATRRPTAPAGESWPAAPAGESWPTAPASAPDLTAAASAPGQSTQADGPVGEVQTPVWFRVWINTFRRPSAGTFQALAADSTATLTRAGVWLFIATQIGLASYSLLARVLYGVVFVPTGGAAEFRVRASSALFMAGWTPLEALAVTAILLVHRHAETDGYRRCKRFRAWSAPNCHRIVALAVLRWLSSACVSRLRVAWSPIRRSQHWRAKTLISNSAMFNQLPCLGV
jgi:hypothetical protein